VRDDRSGPAGKDLDNIQSEADLLRARARRRLVGAAALLLAVVIGAPMLLDTSPPPVSEDIPIELPNDRSPFVARPDAVAASPAVLPDAVAVAQAADAAPAAPASVPDSVADDAAGAATAARADHAADKAATHKEKSPPAHKSHFTVQAASPTHEKDAHDLVDRLGKMGLRAYIEHGKVDGTMHYRVRLGPFASHDEAARVRDQLGVEKLHADILEAP
jgi:DedD protein